ncbi:MAG: SpoIIE family protein phosphatase [Bacteroidales bacterium]|nr:SpoIIE family protein phosphatase [Bacteroidales bacterium]
MNIIVRKSLIITLFLFTIILSVNSQKYYFDNYSVKDGLAQSKIYSIVQDHEGYIWLGTESGISLFDGSKFENYTSDDGLAESAVRTIYLDSENNIWMGHTSGGLTKFDGKNFIKIVHDSLNIEGDITSIFEDKKKQIWIGTHGDGAFVITNPFADIVSDYVIKNYSGKEKLSDRIFKIFCTKKNQVFFIIDGGVKYFDEENNTFEFFTSKGLPKYFQITCMHEDKKGNLWFGSYNGGLYKQNLKYNSFFIYDVRDGLAHNWISSISEDHFGNIWVGTWGGGITKINDNEIKVFNINNGLTENKIRSIIEDREGNMLIGTNENGLSIFKGEQFISFSEDDGLINEQVSAIQLDKQGKFWFGTKSGISIYNPHACYEDSKFKPFYIKNLYTGENEEFNKEVVFIKEDNNKNIWIGTKEDGIFRYNIFISKLEYIPKLNFMLSQCKGIITSMEIDKKNDLWLGTIDGLIYYEIENDVMARLTTINGLAGNDISTVYCDSKNIIWVGSKGKGLANINDTIFTKIEKIGKITPTSVTEDKEGNIWVGTEGQGLIKYLENDSVIKYKVKDGLLANLITSLNIDNNDNIWIGSNKGLNKFIKSENKFYTYTQRLGFTGIEVKNNACFKDNNGNMWFGTVKGVFKFNPKAERINNLEPLTHLRKLKVNLKERDIIPDLKLNYREKSFIFDYNSICITDPDKVMYQVMLEGADDEWQLPTKQTFKNYSPLPPGKYTLKIKACNNNEIWNSKPVSYSFVIKPPFYATWWFILICIIIGAFAIISYIKAREKHLIREKIILEQKVKQRTKQIQQKNEELAKKNKNITDSIRYAKRIQEAILPTEKQVEEKLSNSFVLFKPKDIVSGDFYWLEKIKNKILFSAIDCTGHGVPGAFMSILGSNGLHRSVSEFNLEKPGEIMDKLNDLVQETLQSSINADVKDGMDMALCVLDIEKKQLEYSGANNSIYIIREKGKILEENKNKFEPTLEGETHDLYEIKANKQPIGAYFNRKNFTTHTFKLEKDDTIYLFSDGFADQFGGPKGRKFMYKPFKRLILSLQDKEMHKQKNILNDTIDNWMEDVEQIDDICLIGVRIS